MEEILKLNEGYDLHSFPELEDDESAKKFVDQKIDQVKQLKEVDGKSIVVLSIDNVLFKWSGEDMIFKLTADVKVQYK